MREYYLVLGADLLSGLRLVAGILVLFVVVEGSLFLRLLNQQFPERRHPPQS